MGNLAIRPLEGRDVARISAAFNSLGWDKPRSHIARYLSEQQRGMRTVFVAFVGEDFAGYSTVVWTPSYPSFLAAGIPEIQDFNVLPRFRRQGIGILKTATQAVAVSVGPRKARKAKSAYSRLSLPTVDHCSQVENPCG